MLEREIDFQLMQRCFCVSLHLRTSRTKFASRRLSWSGGKPQSPTQVTQALADRLGCHPEDLAQLLGVEAMQVAQDQKCTVICIQVAFEQVSNRRRFRRIGRRLSPGQEQPLERASPATASSVRIERAVARNSEQPRLLIHDPLQLPPVFERRKQRVLQEVFGEIAIADELNEKQPDPAAMLLDQAVERNISLSRLGDRTHHCERCRFSPSCDRSWANSRRRRREQA